MKDHVIKGDFVVVGTVVGTHVIEDLKLPVPFQVAVHIPAEAAYRSKDLWMGIQQNRMMLLKGGSGLTTLKGAPAKADEPSLSDLRKKIKRLEDENRRLHGELDSTRAQRDEAQLKLSTEGDKLEAILTAIENLRVGGVLVSVSESASDRGVIDDEVPYYIPKDGFKGKGSTSSIQVRSTKVNNSTVGDAADRLKKLRRKP